jgi:hypothetical protein
MSVPVRVPVAVGVNVIAMMQFLPAETAPLVGQVVEGASAKSPLTLMLDTFSVTVCAFFRVTFFAALVVPTVWLANATFGGDSFTSVPKPTRMMLGLPASALTLSEPWLPPVAVGLNVTLIEQLAWAASTPEHVVVVLLKLPLVPIPDMFRGTLCRLNNMTL